jgi:O-acetyl-ADP-ribose deacetylase (regulator of RNase III)
VQEVGLLQFARKLYTETEIRVDVRNILSAPTEAIVNPSNSGLSHEAGLSAMIAEAAGEFMEQDCQKIIQKFGKIPKTYAIPSNAGNLPYNCIIHAVSPRMGDGRELELLKITVKNVMRLCYKKCIKSVAFPAINTVNFGVPTDICAIAITDALSDFWRDIAHRETELVWVCLSLDEYPEFEKVMNC